MDSFDVQEFLLTTTGGSESILFDTDKIFDKNDKSGEYTVNLYSVALM